MSSEPSFGQQPPRQSKLASLGLLALGVLALGLGGVATISSGCRHSETMARLDHLNGRLEQATRNRDQDETERVAQYIAQDVELASSQKSGRNLWAFVAVGGAMICAAGGMLFMRGRHG